MVSPRKRSSNLWWNSNLVTSPENTIVNVNKTCVCCDSRAFLFAVSVCQSDARELEVQPFGVSVCEETDRVVVTCCTPTFLGVSTANQLFIYHAANFTRLQTVALSGAYNILRSAIVIGNNFAVCHGWFKPGKVTIFLTVDYLSLGGNVFAKLCLSVCLSLCQQDNSKSYGWIFLKFSGMSGMAKTTSVSILGVIRKESWILDHFESFVNIAFNGAYGKPLPNRIWWRHLAYNMALAEVCGLWLRSSYILLPRSAASCLPFCP